MFLNLYKCYYALCVILQAGFINQHCLPLYAYKVMYLTFFCFFKFLPNFSYHKLCYRKHFYTSLFRHMCKSLSWVHIWNVHFSIILYQDSCSRYQFPIWCWDTRVLDVRYRCRVVKKQGLLEDFVLIAQITWEKNFNLQLKQWILGTRWKEIGFSFGLQLTN